MNAIETEYVVALSVARRIEDDERTDRRRRSRAATRVQRARAAMVTAGYDDDWLAHFDEVALLDAEQMSEKLRALGRRNARAAALDADYFDGMASVGGAMRRWIDGHRGIDTPLGRALAAGEDEDDFPRGPLNGGA